MQDHAIAHVLVDCVAAGREHGYTPSIADLPDLLAPAQQRPPPEHGIESHFSKEPLIEYREVAAEMDRQDYIHAQIEGLNEEEELEAPRG